MRRLSKTKQTNLCQFKRAVSRYDKQASSLKVFTTAKNHGAGCLDDIFLSQVFDNHFLGITAEMCVYGLISILQLFTP